MNATATLPMFSLTAAGASDLAVIATMSNGRMVYAMDVKHAVTLGANGNLAWVRCTGETLSTAPAARCVLLAGTGVTNCPACAA